jgi:hypothetical protein
MYTLTFVYDTRFWTIQPIVHNHNHSVDDAGMSSRGDGRLHPDVHPQSDPFDMTDLCN